MTATVTHSAATVPARPRPRPPVPAGAQRAYRAPAAPVPAAASRPETVWRADDLTRWVLLNALAAALVIVGWYTAGGEGSFNDQFTGADLAVGGAIVSGVANAVWIMRGRRTVGERLRGRMSELESVLTEMEDERAAAHQYEYDRTATEVFPVHGAIDRADTEVLPVVAAELADDTDYTEDGDGRHRAIGHGPIAHGPLVGTDGMKYFHRPDCQMARGRNWPTHSLTEHIDAGRGPCPICAP